MRIDLSRALLTMQNMVNGFFALLPNLIVALVVFILTLFLGRGIRNLVSGVAARYQSQNRSVGVLLGRLAQVGVVIIGLLIALTIAIPSFQPAQVVQLLGVTSVAIGFAFKDIFQNFLGGILLLMTQPFRIGDQIVTEGFEGTVEDIQTRATFIRTYDGRRVVIPNAQLFTGSVVVNTAFDNRRSELTVGIGYGDNVEEAKRLVLEAIHQTEGVLEHPAPDVLLLSLDDSSVNLRARWWSKPQRGEVLIVQDRVTTAIKTSLTEQGIDLPFPTQVVLFHDQTEETDGDRARQREGWPKGKTVPRPRYQLLGDGDRRDATALLAGTTSHHDRERER